MAGAGAILKLPDIAGSLSGLRNAFKGISSSNWFKGLAGGLATFFSFEWLTSGGLVDSVSGTFGISEMGGTILIIAIVAGGLWLVFRYLDSRIPSKPRASGGNGGGNGGGGNRHKKRKGGSR